MRRWTLFALPLLTACMGAGNPVVLSNGMPDGGREPGSVTTPPPVGGPLGHDGFALLLNDERTGAGVVAVMEDSRLSLAAQSHAQDMVSNRYLSHTDLTGGSPGDRALAAGYDWDFIAENIARGFSTESGVMSAWMDSPGHRDNIVDPRAEDFGLGRVENTWVLMLGREFD